MKLILAALFAAGLASSAVAGNSNRHSGHNFERSIVQLFVTKKLLAENNRSDSLRSNRNYEYTKKKSRPKRQRLARQNRNRAERLGARTHRFGLTAHGYGGNSRRYSNY
ncbi:MAG: hypothetical protein ABJL67_02570 [Sulfitobacter sp.]